MVFRENGAGSVVAKRAAEYKGGLWKNDSLKTKGGGGGGGGWGRVGGRNHKLQSLMEGSAHRL